MRIAQDRERILLIGRDGKRYLIRLQAGDRFHTQRGMVQHDDIIGQPLGREVLSHLGQPFMVLHPSIHDLLMNLKRVSQIIYPKEIGQILLKLDITNGRRVIEAGTGSGALTMALAYGVRPDGIVYSYESRADMLNVARKNLDAVGLLEHVRLTQRDIREGFDETDVDAVFLDVREPWDHIPQVCDALSDGGFFGALVPTTNQVSWLLAELGRQSFTGLEVMEVLLRHYKPVPARLRPEDVMVGHTGFLVFARKVSFLPLDEEESVAEDGEGPEEAPDDAIEDDF